MNVWKAQEIGTPCLEKPKSPFKERRKTKSICSVKISSRVQRKRMK